MGGPSPVAAIAVGLLGLAGFILAFIGVRSASAARYRTGASTLIRPVVFVGVSLMLLTLAASGFRHFGGFVGDDAVVPRSYACNAWWYAMGTTHGVSDQYQSAAYCHADAVSAIGPSTGESLGVGAIAGAITASIVFLARRRHDRRLDSLLDQQSDAATS